MRSKNDFDAEEREFASRVRLPRCPDFALLYSAHEGVLPEEQAEQIRSHMSECEVCTRLFEDCESIDFGTPTALEAAHIRDRIQQKAPRAFHASQPESHRLRRKWWLAALAVAAAVVAIFFVVRPPTPERATQVAQAPAHPTTQSTGTTLPNVPEVPLEKLAIHLDPAALLVTRGARNPAQPSGSEIAKALRPYQLDDYVRSAQLLKLLSQKYPQDGTVQLYLGISELFLHHDAQAADDLTMAAAYTHGSRLADSQWYLAIAELRVKNPDSAEPLFHDLCHGKSGYSQRACEIESQLK
jgi:hypothetical protein